MELVSLSVDFDTCGTWRQVLNLTFILEGGFITRRGKMVWQIRECFEGRKRGHLCVRTAP
jgi:hypothetical protein